MRKMNLITAPLFALAMASWMAPAMAQAPDAAAPAADAPAKPAKTTHHKAAAKPDDIHRGVTNEPATEDLNAKSLDAAKSGKSFTPPAPAAATPAPKKAAHKATHKAAKKPAADAAAKTDAPK